MDRGIPLQGLNATSSKAELRIARSQAVMSTRIPASPLRFRAAMSSRQQNIGLRTICRLPTKQKLSRFLSKYIGIYGHILLPVMHQVYHPAHSFQQLLRHDSNSIKIMRITPSKQLDMNRKSARLLVGKHGDIRQKCCVSTIQI